MQVTVPDVPVGSGHSLLGRASPGVVQEQTHPTAAIGVVCLALELGLNPD